MIDDYNRDSEYYIDAIKYLDKEHRNKPWIYEENGKWWYEDDTYTITFMDHADTYEEILHKAFLYIMNRRQIVREAYDSLYDSDSEV